MGAVLLSPLYVLLNVYLIFRMLIWFATLHSFLGSLWFIVPFLTFYILVSLSPLGAAFGRGKLKVLSRQINNYWLGTLMYLLISMLLVDLCHILYCVTQGRPLLSPMSKDAYRITGAVIFTLVTALSIYGIFHAAHLKTTPYDALIHKACPLSSLKIALVADLHLGGNFGVTQARGIRRIVQKIRPDLIVFAGDIFDNDYDAIAHPEQIASIFKKLKSTYGSYACWGNHDIDELILAGFTFDSGKETTASDPRMDQFLKSSGIQLLKDETILLDNAFYLSGRLDASCKQKSGITRLTPKELISPLRPTLPVLIIDHQPSELNELADAGADLVLSGHTHDGQIFPGNLTTKMGWQNSCGKLEIGSMTSIVTSGAGIWGPAMRIGTDSEVVEISVEFAVPH